MTDEIRPLPSAEGPERSILSCMMQDDAEDHLDRADGAGLTKEHFYLLAHARLYGVLQQLRQQGKPIELVSLTHTLREKGYLENIGGASELTTIYTYSPTAAHFDYHLDIVRKRFMARQGIAAALKASTALYGAEADETEGELAKLSETTQRLLGGMSSDDGDFSAKELMGLLTDNVERCIDGSNNEVIPTPWENFNKLLNGGLGVGEIVFVAARPSMGKTALTLQLVIEAAENGFPAQFISLESGELKIANRLAASMGAGNVSDLSKGNVTKGDLIAIQRAAKRISPLPIRVRKMHGPTGSQVASAVRKAVRDHGAKIVAIDYLQLIRASGGAEQSDMRLRMDNALDALCPLASKLGICLVILAQLNREAEGKDGRDLNLSMLKETSRIEQDADTIIMIGPAHDHVSDGVDREPRVVHVPKNRDGPTSFARLQFHGPTTTFH